MNARQLLANPHVRPVWAVDLDAITVRARSSLAVFAFGFFPGAREVVRRVRAVEGR